MHTHIRVNFNLIDFKLISIHSVLSTYPLVSHILLVVTLTISMEKRKDHNGNKCSHFPLSS